MTSTNTKLKLLKPEQYEEMQLDNPEDPIQIYFRPLVGGYYRRRVELCLKELIPGNRVLEIGYGSGVAFLNLHEKFREIHGLDLISPSERVAEKYHSLGIVVNLREGDVLKMPYPDGYFDSVLAVSIFEHLKPEEQTRAMKEIRRVLKPGGQLVYGVPVASRTMAFLYRLLGYNIEKYHYSTEGVVAQAADQCLEKRTLKDLYALPGFIRLYQVGHFIKN